jgi:hypothetical protein
MSLRAIGLTDGFLCLFPGRAGGPCCVSAEPMPIDIFRICERPKERPQRLNGELRQGRLSGLTSEQRLHNFPDRELFRTTVTLALLWNCEWPNSASTQVLSGEIMRAVICGAV